MTCPICGQTAVSNAAGWLVCPATGAPVWTTTGEATPHPHDVPLSPSLTARRSIFGGIVISTPFPDPAQPDGRLRIRLTPRELRALKPLIDAELAE